MSPMRSFSLGAKSKGVYRRHFNRVDGPQVIKIALLGKGKCIEESGGWKGGGAVFIRKMFGEAPFLASVHQSIQ